LTAGLGGCTPAILTSWLKPLHPEPPVLNLTPDRHKTEEQTSRVQKKKENQAATKKRWLPLDTQTLEELLFLADQQFQQQNFFAAGKLYRQVRLELRLPQAAVSNVSISLAELDRQLESCANQLLTQGLLAYRHGNLEEALEIWHKINIFNPQHTASQRAIQTTRLQLKNLEKLPAT
jgi:tetratricopeptide (TPR) repeat protein